MADDIRKPDHTPDKPGFKAKPAAGEPKQPKPGETIRIDGAAPGQAAPKKETTRIDVAAAKPIGPPTPGPKSETTRLDVASAKPPPAAPAQRTPGPSGEDVFKQSTVRIETAGAAKSEPPKAKAETQRVPTVLKGAPSLDEAKRSTLRIEIADQPGAKKDTTRLVVPPEPAKSQTSKIDVRQATGTSTDDLMKRSTIPVGIPTAPPPPSAAGRPKTIQIKRPAAVPGETIIVAPAATERVAAEAKKSETARIDLPAEAEERPATRPKTIRIKRPDGTTARKPLTIARPSAEEEIPAVVQVAAVGDALPGTLYSVLAILTVIVVLVLIYVLAAQTISPDLPFPGRIS